MLCETLRWGLLADFETYQKSEVEMVAKVVESAIEVQCDHECRY
jgi:hypothetical protein